MSVKFTYSRDDGIQIECEDGAELTEEQARIIAVRSLANNVWAFNRNFCNLVEAFEAKQFFKED